MVPHFHRILYTLLCGSDFVYGTRHRHDGVLFNLDGMRQVGMVDSICAHSGRHLPGGFRAFLIRLIDRTQPQAGNTSLVIQYGHARYRYSLPNSGFVRTVLMPSPCLLQPALLVIDPYWMRQSCAVQSKFEKVRDGTDTQDSVRFFSVKHFSLFRRSQVPAPLST